MRRSSAGLISRILAGAAVLLTSTSSTQAVTLLSTGIGVTGVNTGSPLCFVANIGTEQVRVNSVKLIDKDGSQLVASSDCTLPGNIFPGLTCTIEGPNDFNELRCVIEVATSAGAKNIRGTLQLWLSEGGIGPVLEAR